MADASTTPKLDAEVDARVKGDLRAARSDPSAASRAARHAGRAASAVGQSANTAIQNVHEAALGPVPQNWGGYWTFVTATITLMFILYLAQQGRLQVWLAFFTWSNPTTPVVGGGTQPGTPVGTVLGVPGITTLSPGATGIVTNNQGQTVMNPGPTISFGSVWQSLFGGGSSSGAGQ